MKLIIESWREFLKEEVLSEAAVDNIDRYGLLVYPSMNNPEYVIIYNYLMAKPSLRKMNYDQIERTHQAILKLRFNNSKNSLEVDQIWGKSGFGPTLYRIAGQIAKQNNVAGIMPSAVKGEVSDEAKNVWSNFYSGIGSSYLEATPYEGNHDEDYLNSIYSLKDGSNTISLDKAVANSQRTLSTEQHKNAILDTADNVLGRAMQRVYGDTN
jgi:hypothetical protein